MALAPIPFIAPPGEEKKKKGHKGGFGGAVSGVGAAVGGVAGGMAGMAAGGPAGAVAGAMGGAAGGASFGNMLGEAIDPSKQATSVMQQRVATQAPELPHSETSAKLKESIAALSRAPDPIRIEYSKPLVDAYMASIAQANKGQV